MFEVAKSRIKYFVFNLIHSLLKAYVSDMIRLNEIEKRNSVLKQVRDIKGCQIHDSFFYIESIVFYVKSNVLNFIINENVTCRSFCNFSVYEGANLIIGKNVFFNNYCSVNCLCSIEIGDGTIFGEGVKIYDHNHLINKTETTVIVSKDDFVKKPIKIGEKCWIGSNVTILQGVVIGDNVVIGANNLIFNSIPSNTIVKAVSDKIITTL
jgi:acetyltransferase-like isoleucine patch superfamily enzyme